MGNEIRTKVTLQIADSPRGSWQKMLVVTAPMAFLATTAWIREEGADGAVLHFANSGLRPRLVGGKKIFEFDEGLLFFPLTKNTHPILADAVIRGSTLHIPHIPAEINPPSRYIEVPAPAKIPTSGPPVRIMRPIKIRLSQSVNKAFNSYGCCLYFDKELVTGMERVSMKSYGSDGFQLVQDPDGLKVLPSPLSPRACVKFSQGGVVWTTTKCPVKQFEMDAQYDEASRSIICEDGIAILQQRIKEVRGTKRQDVTVVVENGKKAASKTNGTHVGFAQTGDAMSRIERATLLLSRSFNGCEYEQGWSDARIGQETGVDITWVQQTRKLLTKPLDPKQQQIDALTKTLAEVTKALASLKT